MRPARSVWRSLLLCALPVAAAAVPAALLVEADSAWYLSLQKPAFNPPPWAYSAALSLVYLCAAAALYPLLRGGIWPGAGTVAALAAAEAVIPFNGPLNGDLVGQALQGVKVPGRIEQIRTSPTIILDGGHNVNAAEALRKAIEESYDFTQLVGVVAMMGDKQVEEYLGVLEPILSQVVVTENSWRDRVMPAEELEKIAVQVFGRDRVIREDSLPDAIQKAVDMVDVEDETGVGYGRGVLVCGSFVTAGDARTLLKERMNADLAKPKAERVNPSVGEPEPRTGTGDPARSGVESDADTDFATDANPDFNENDFGDFGFDKAAKEAAKEADEEADAADGGPQGGQA